MKMLKSILKFVGYVLIGMLFLEFAISIPWVIGFIVAFITSKVNFIAILAKILMIFIGVGFSAAIGYTIIESIREKIK